MVPRDSASTDPDVTFDIFVNDQRKPLEVSYFADRSDVLTAGNTNDPQKQIRLTDIKEGIFEMYVDCVRDGSNKTKIRSWAGTFEQSMKPNVGKRKKQRAADAVFMKLIHLNMLAKELEDDALANDAVDEIVRFSHVTNMIPANPVSTLYDLVEDGDLDESDRLRRLMNDFRLYETVANGNQRFREEISEMTAKLDIAIRALDYMRPIPNSPFSVMNNWLRDPCRYHDHKNSKRCEPRGTFSENSGKSSICVKSCRIVLWADSLL